MNFLVPPKVGNDAELSATVLVVTCKGYRVKMNDVSPSYT